MSAKTTGVIWDLAVTVPWRMVLLAMVDHADHDGAHMRASQAFIAWKTGYSSRNVARVIQDMLAEHLLVLTDESIGQENEYRIDLTVARLKPAFHGRKPKAAPTTHDKMSGVKRATHDKMSGVGNGTHDKMSPPHDKMSGATHDMLAIDSSKYHVGDDHVGGDGARALEKYLSELPMFPATVTQILALQLDPSTVIAACEMLRAAGWGIGAIADQIRKHPPVKGQPYAKPERSRSDNAPDQPRGYARSEKRPRGSHNPSGGAELRDPGWKEREIARIQQLYPEADV